MHEANEMQRICELNAPQIKTILDPLKLLKTICRLESSFGNNCLPRFEPAYYPSGLYFAKSKLLKEAWDLWGPLVSFSYGPFQMLYCKLLELGYPLQNSPLDAWNGYVSGPYVIELLNDITSRGFKTLEEILSGYNGGLMAIKKPNPGVLKYVANGLQIYNSL